MGKINYKKIISIVKEAGEILLEAANNKLEIKEKGKANYVTDLDKKIEQFIFEKINKKYPGEIIVSEEIEDDNIYQSFWILDPIDGTTNMIHGFPSFTISLAHVIESEVVFGVVYNPISKELFFANKNEGAYLEKDNNISKINVSENNTLKGSLIGFGFPYDKSKINYLFSILSPIISECDDLKRKGPASLDICYVAAGMLDGYLELDLEIWDYSAGKLILLEAGGKITNFKNELPDKKSNILATNGLLHELIIEKIKEQ